MKRLLSLCMVLCMLVGLCGCEILQELEPALALRYEEVYLGFAQTVSEEFAMEEYTRFPVSQVEEHTSQWGQYGVDTYYSRLDAPAQSVYRILRYAMDKEQPYILVDDRLLEGTAFSLQDILYAMALDSPMVEQNLEWKYAEFTSTVTHERLFSDPVVETLTGQSLYISDFEPAKLEKKRQALGKAQELLASFPEDLTPRQTAEAIYAYLGKNVTYFNTEENREEIDYLYDALCVGRTNCDGFANAFSLLCSLSGIRCCEKLFTAEAEGEEGHTWNAVELDGVWYNVDATAANEVGREESLRLHFGFPDNRQEQEAWRSDLCPPCTQELYPFDCSLSGEKGAGKVLRTALKKTDRDYLIVNVESGVLSDKTLQDIANTTRHDIMTYHTETRDGAAVYYIYFD